MNIRQATKDMKKGIKIVLLFAIICFWQGTLRATQQFFFSRLGVQDGLSQSTVLAIYQDKDGYLWFGTRNGLNKYNGYEFTVYQNEVNDPASLSDNYITCIIQDSQKNVWVGTRNGLNCIDHTDGSVTRFYPKEILPDIPGNNISNFLLHPNGTLYAFTSYGGFKCYPDKTVEPLPAFLQTNAVIYSIAQDQEGDIYIGTDNRGVYIYSSDWEPKGRIANLSPAGLSPSTIMTLLCTDRKIIIGTNDYGIYIFNKDTQEVSHLSKENSFLNNNLVRTLLQIDERTVLIGSFGGVNMLDTETEKILPVQSTIQEEGGLSHYSIHSSLLDKDGTIWLGTYSAGINFYNPRFRPGITITPHTFTGTLGKGEEDKDGNVWFATEGGGLLFYDPVSKEQKIYPLHPLSSGNYEKNIIKTILLQGDSILCTTHFGSIYLFSIPHKRFSLLYDFKKYDIFTLYRDSKDRLWIPTYSEYGLVIAEKGNYRNEFMINGTKQKLRGITVINELEPDLFLLGTSGDSIYLLDLVNETMENISRRIPEPEPFHRIGNTSAIIKEQEYIWIATTRSGLYRFDKELNLQKHYQKQDGLQESYISSMVTDTCNELWITTGSRIYRLNRTEDKFYPVEWPELTPQEYSMYASFVTSDGTLYFPGNKSIQAVNPRFMQSHPVYPPVYINSLSADNQEKQFPFSRTEEKDKKYSYRTTLSPYQRNLTIRYSALNFIPSQHIEYAYLLEGVDPEWNLAGDRREAYYGNLQPGKYLFRLKTSVENGIWDPEETWLHITIPYPFYLTWWAWFIYISLIILIVYKIIRYQQQKQELQREIRFKQMEKEKIKELHEERMRMFGNVSHELRTPLTLIINPLNELLQQINFSPEVKSALSLIRKNTQRLLLLVNNLMDIQKYEAGKSVLQKKPYALIPSLREIFHSFESTARNRDIQFGLNYEISENHIVNYDEREIEKVIFNLLSNAFKFTPSGGIVSLKVKSMSQEEAGSLFPSVTEKKRTLSCPQYIYIEIKDNGKGFGKDEAEKIFEAFYRSAEDLHHEISGTGIGLNLSRSIITEHQGTIRAESSPGKGTRFMILLPDTELQNPSKKKTHALLSSDSPTSEAALLLKESQDKHKKTILITDDDPDIVSYLESRLADEYLTIKAFNGKEALLLMENKLPDLIITDVMMPEMNGLELCKAIKGSSRFCHIPVILLTAKGLNPHITEGLLAEADDYIIKPFDILLLKARIKNMLSIRDKMKNAYGKMFSLKSLGIEGDTSKDSFLSQYLEIVNTNISDPDFDISQIYEAMGLSRASFYRKVKSVTGLSPVELITQIRLEAGARLLRESDLNISEIAQQTGFNSRSYFSKNFKDLFGLTPSEYQRTKGINK